MHSQHRFSRIFALSALMVGTFSTAAVLAAVTFDGLIQFAPGEEWADAQSKAVQDNHTGFGDQTAPGGSEMDELFVRTDGSFLYVAITGNLEQNGNAYVLLLDVRPGGQNPLKTEIAPIVAELPCSGNGPPSAVQGLGEALTSDEDLTIRCSDAPEPCDPPFEGTVLDEGFAPDYAIAVDTFGGTVFVTQYDLSDESLGTWDDPGTNDGELPCENRNEELDYFTTRIYRGSVGVNTGSGLLTGGTNPNGSQFAFNNTGIAGVTDTAVAPAGSSQPGDPRTQTTGLEARISLLDLGFDSGELPLTGDLTISLAAILTSANGFVSNQTLPGIGGGAAAPNLGSRPDFTAVSGNQFATITRTPAVFSPVLNGQNIVSEWGTGADSLVASQDTATSFGDQIVPNPSAGSELNQMFVQDGEDTLQVAITGNLETNGNRLVLFIDSIPDMGQTTLAGNEHPLDGGWDDVVLPMAADYAIVITNQGVWIDFFDLNAQTKTFLGGMSVNSSATFELDGTWNVAILNTNTAGVNSNPADDPSPQQQNALTANTGFELSIPLTAIGSPPQGTQVCVFAGVAGETGFLSNQFLPAGLGGGRSNLGFGFKDLAAQGYQCLPMHIGGPLFPCNNPRFDADGDGDVDMDDFAVFQACYTGATGTPGDPAYPPECHCFDWGGMEKDGRIDVQDFGAFQLCETRASVPADPACDDPPE